MTENQDQIEVQAIRRQMITLLATGGELDNLSEDIGEDALPYALQALAAELLETSVKVNTDLLDELEGLKVAVATIGALVAGLVGLPRKDLAKVDGSGEALDDLGDLGDLDHLMDEVQIEATRDLFWRRGAEIRDRALS